MPRCGWDYREYPPRIAAHRRDGKLEHSYRDHRFSDHAPLTIGYDSDFAHCVRRPAERHSALPEEGGGDSLPHSILAHDALRAIRRHVASRSRKGNAMKTVVPALIRSRLRAAMRRLLVVLTLLGLGAGAAANTLTQNVSWTIDRAGTTTKYRIVAYGDSIYAGYNGSITNAAKYAAPTVDAEYLSALWNADIESVRRAKSGAVASDIYNNKIVAERSYMQASSTRVVTFEMCGNDGLQARSSFKGQTGTCDYSGLDHGRLQLREARRGLDGLHQRERLSRHQAQDHLEPVLPGLCRRQRAEFVPGRIDRHDGEPARRLPAPARRHELLDVRVRAAEGLPVRGQLRRSTWAPTSTATATVRSTPRRCAMWPARATSSYVNRITSTLRSTIRDANTHFVSASSSYDYIQSDDTHPTYTGGTVNAGLFGGTTGTGAPRYTLVYRRQEPDLEPVRSRAHGLGAVDLEPGGSLTRAGHRPMDERRRPEPPSADPAGAGAGWRPSLGLLAVAAGIVLCAVVWWWTAPASLAEVAPAATAPPAPVATSGPAPAVQPTAVATADGSSPAIPVAAAPAPTPRIRRNRDPDGDQTPDLSDYVNEGERPTMSEVIDRLHQAGVSSGLGAFSPPGTRPPLVGLAVPEDFVLPDGYVRHYQATDDGQRIEPILMFAPDRQFVDAAGQPIEIPRDRVVPPELAPPGIADPTHRDPCPDRAAEVRELNHRHPMDALQREQVGRHPRQRGAVVPLRTRWCRLAARIRGPRAVAAHA